MTKEEISALRKERKRLIREVLSIVRIARFMTDKQLEPYVKAGERIKEINELLAGIEDISKLLAGGNNG